MPPQPGPCGEALPRSTLWRLADGSPPWDSVGIAKTNGWGLLPSRTASIRNHPTCGYKVPAPSSHIELPLQRHPSTSVSQRSWGLLWECLQLIFFLCPISFFSEVISVSELASWEIQSVTTGLFPQNSESSGFDPTDKQFCKDLQATLSHVSLRTTNQSSQSEMRRPACKRNALSRFIKWRSLKPHYRPSGLYFWERRSGNLHLTNSSRFFIHTYGVWNHKSLSQALMNVFILSTCRQIKECNLPSQLQTFCFLNQNADVSKCDSAREMLVTPGVFTNISSSSQ